MTDVDLYDLADEMAEVDRCLAADLEVLGPDMDIDRANRTLRAYARTTRERSELAAQFDDEIARLTARRDDLCAGLDRRAEWLRAQLEAYHTAVLAEDPTAKTIHLPAGDLKARATKGRVVIDDREALVEWCRDNWPAAVEQVDRLRSVTDLRSEAHEADDGRLIAPTGEALPGVRVEGAGHNWTITPAEGDA